MSQGNNNGPAGLVVLWVSRDPEAAMNMAFMYGKNSKLKGWWEDVKLVVWGPSVQLLCEDAALQEELAAMGQAGVELLACRACADRYGATARLEEMGIDVIYMGQPMTKFLKEGWAVITV